MLLSCQQAAEQLTIIKNLQKKLDEVLRTGHENVAAIDEAQKIRDELHVSLEKINRELRQYNPEIAELYGLKEVELEAYPEAQRLMKEIFEGGRDMSWLEDQNLFAEAWKKNVPDLPPPCSPEVYGYYYVCILAPAGKRRIYGSATKNKGEPFVRYEPSYDREEVILLEDNFNPDASAQDTQASSIYKDLGFSSPVLSRLEIDNALWRKNVPDERIPTNSHWTILKNLGLDPTLYEIRLPRHDEFLRLQKSKGSHLWDTHLDGYCVSDGEVRNIHGLTVREGVQSENNVHGKFYVASLQDKKTTCFVIGPK